jgi:histidine triad (HIT) family protein
MKPKEGVPMPSIFTRIIHREIPAYILYEDDIIISFLDISQATPGHTLIVTKMPYENIYELPQDVASHVFKHAVLISNAIKKAFDPMGMNILSNAGEKAGQSVFHFHLHLIPRYETDEVTFHFPNHVNNTQVEMYQARLEMIKAALS